MVMMMVLLVALRGDAQSFGAYTSFPEPAVGAFGVLGTGLPDGRLLVWNGDQIFIQTFAGADGFLVLASGYAGDPGFIALAPNGHEVLLGQGFGGNIYSFDINNPVDYGPSQLVTTVDHYSGTYLSETLFLIDAGKSDFTGSELVMLDLSATKGAQLRSVVTKDESYASANKDIIVEKPLFGWSAKLGFDKENGYIYAMDAGQRELRVFMLSDILNAFNTSSPLDWATDGQIVGAAGDFYSGGVAGIRPGGNLIIDGSEGYLQPGGIQLVDPNPSNFALASVLTTLDPAGTQGFYSVIYNAYTDTISALVDGVPYGEDDQINPVPVAGPLALVLLVMSFVYLGRRKLAA